MEGRSKRRSIEVPETVAMDILSKLPVKSLLRFRSVCKSWCYSFQTSHFITQHHQNNLKNNHHLNLLLKHVPGDTHGDGPIHQFSAVSIEKGQNFLLKENIHFPLFEKSRHAPPSVSGPCNGLLCLCVADKAILWNPSTREFKTLPPSPLQNILNTIATPILFFGLELGFDPKTDDYKVVRFFLNCVYSWNYQVELYSLKSDSWKGITVPKAIPSGSGSGLSSCYINGFWYWHAADTGLLDSAILSLDMANEKFSTLPLPEFGGSFEKYAVQVLDFNGSLGVIFHSRRGTEKFFDIWVMMSGSWTKQFSVESVSGVEWPLGFCKNGELFLAGSNNELLLFDPASRELKNLGVHAPRNAFQLIAYVESLVPINGQSENEEYIIRQPAGDASNRN
ncbi:hypothetical protein PTKIN_Ptkin11bG0063800 [Pterospermum kingtungense]